MDSRMTTTETDWRAEQARGTRPNRWRVLGTVGSVVNLSESEARLIAAAPDMLAALQELEASIERRWAGETGRKRENAISPRTEDALVAARATLKAAGRAPQ